MALEDYRDSKNTAPENGPGSRFESQVERPGRCMYLVEVLKIEKALYSVLDLTHRPVVESSFLFRFVLRSLVFLRCPNFKSCNSQRGWNFESIVRLPLQQDRTHFRPQKAKGMGSDLMHRESSKSYHEVDQRAAKISFSKKLKLPAEECDSFHSHHSRNDPQGKEREMFFARIGGFPEEGVKWIAENLKGIKLNISLPENLGGGAAFHGKAQQRVSFARNKGGRQLCFARVTDRFDPATQEKLEEVKEQVEEITEDVTETAQKARVPVPSASLPYIGFVHSLTVKNLLCGILAGAVASVFAVPLDILRTRAVAGQGGQNIAGVFSTVIREEGLQSIWKGSLQISLIQKTFEKGLQFTTFEFVKRNQEQHHGGQKRVLPLPRQIPVATAGGAAAGFVGTLLTYPLAPVFDRLLLEPSKYTGIGGTFKQILQNEGGLRELYRGITPALISIVPSAAVSFYTYDTLKTKHFFGGLKGRPELEALRSLVIGGLAGLVSTTVTYPLDLARKEIILSTLSSTAVQSPGVTKAHYNNTWQALNGIVKTQGFEGLYRGLPAKALEIVPLTAVTFLVYELAKRAFVASGEERRDEIKDVDDLDD